MSWGVCKVGDQSHLELWSGGSSGFEGEQSPQVLLLWVSDLGLVSPRRPGQQGCESKCVKKASGPFTVSRICGHAGLLGQLDMDCSHVEAPSAPHPWEGVLLRRASGDSAQAGTPEQVCSDSLNPESTLHTRNKQWGLTWGETTSPENAEGEGSRLTHHLTLRARTRSPGPRGCGRFVPRGRGHHRRVYTGSQRSSCIKSCRC